MIYRFLRLFMKKVFCFLTLFTLLLPVYPQGPYKLNPWIDIPVTVGGAGLSFLGLRYLRDKPYLDSAYVASLKPEDINRFDRGATRHNGKNDGLYSDIALFSSFALPLFLVSDKEIRSDALKVGFLYVETMAIMANAYVWGVGTTNRKRPYVYNPDVPFEKKLKRGTTNSFFAGHPAAAAASTFFFAKVFSDYHPESKLKNIFWATAVIPPAIVAYYRYKDGQHFPTDILVGIPLGAAIGIIVPHLHKVKNKSNLSVYPSPGGIGMLYRY